MKFLLIITTIAFSILAIVSAWGFILLTVFILATTPMSWVDYLWLFIFWMIPVAFVAGQWLAWRGYNLKKTILIVLGMCLSFSPIMVWLIQSSYCALERRYY